MITIEAKGMRFLPNICWETAKGVIVTDSEGNKYLDFTSGVMISNAGHGHAKIREAILAQLNKPLLTSYLFPNQAKTDFLSALKDVIPENYKVALLTTGSEAIELSIKLSRLWALQSKPTSKGLIISYHNAFHGRTMAAQAAGGDSKLKAWLPEDLLQTIFKQVPYPDGFYEHDISFDGFLQNLTSLDIKPIDIAAVLIEPYQGSTVAKAPNEYLAALRQWCTEQQILLIVDEVQSGFGRTGKWWAYEHAGITPDLIVAGKGITSSLPMSAVISRADILDNPVAVPINSTHSGNPLCCAAALASLTVLQEENLVENAANVGHYLRESLTALAQKYPTIIRRVFIYGLVAAIHTGDMYTNMADSALAQRIADALMANKILIYGVGGPENATIKLAPPLCISMTDIDTLMSVLTKIIRSISDE